MLSHPKSPARVHVIQHLCGVPGVHGRNQEDLHPSYFKNGSIDETLRQMMDSVEVEWFNNAAERVDGYYKRLGRSRMASVILNFLSRDEGLGADPPGSAHERQELRIDAG